jgi:hypothetical protein
MIAVAPVTSSLLELDDHYVYHRSEHAGAQELLTGWVPKLLEALIFPH